MQGDGTIDHAYREVLVTSAFSALDSILVVSTARLARLTFQIEASAAALYPVAAFEHLEEPDHLQMTHRKPLEDSCSLLSLPYLALHHAHSSQLSSQLFS